MIDFNNDALPLMADTLRPLIGEQVTIDLAPDGYDHGKLVAVDSDGGPHIYVQHYTDADYDGTGRASGTIRRLHASEDCRRIRICR